MGLYLQHADTLRSPKTAKNHAIRCTPWIAGKRASDAPAVAAKMAQDMHGMYKPATINRSVGALSKAVRLAYKLRIIDSEYAGLIERVPENNMRTTTLTVAQVKKLTECASNNVRAAIWIALYTGCRRGEICSIEAQDIGEDAITLRAGNTKTLRTRSIPIVSPLRPWLRFLPLPINAEGLKSGFQRARVKAGLEHVNFHDLRRSCGTLMIEAGVDLYVVSKLLGHSSVKVTQDRYAHLQTQRIAEGLEKTFG